MVAYRRNFLPGGTFFFTVVLKDRRSALLVEHIDLLRQALRRAREQQPFSIIALVVLPEHLHTVLTLPEHDADFPGRWRRIKALFTRSLAPRGIPVVRNARGEYSVWQRRFREHTIRDEADLERHVDYIHFNPVKHGLVAQVREWPFSSFHQYVRRGWLPPDWGGTMEDSAKADFGEPQS